MFCPKCGNEVAPGQQFCPTCGAQMPNLGGSPNPMPNQAPMQDPTPMQSQRPVRNQPKKKKSSAIPILIGVIAALIIAVVVVLVLILTKKDDSASSTPNTPKQDAEAEWTMPPGGGNSEGEFVDEEDFDPDDMPNDHDNLTYETVAKQKMDDETVNALTKEDRRYYVNTLYAYYGYRFKNKEMQSFFDSQEWYEPDTSIEPGDQDSISKKFDSIAKYNLKKLQ